MKLDSNNHSVFSLHYHLVMCIKYRRKVIDESISNRLKDIFVDISHNYGVELIEWNHDVDHVHLLFKAKPNTEISKLLNAYKSASSRRIKNEFSIIRKHLWKEYFWSKSYCLVTIGGAPLEIVKQYIENQGK
ncbi:IS200/IS605 family transposase [Clostridioides difficile]|nr:IS200/IS605 family transposase [Clostridioides difficile]